MNLYKFCANNSIIYIDAYGLSECSSSGGGGGPGHGRPPVPKKPNNKGKNNSKFAYGLSINASWINPLTSHGGGVLGMNNMKFSNQKLKFYDYGSLGDEGAGFDFGVSGEFVIAHGKGPWEGKFKAWVFSLPWGTISYFYSPGKKWQGVSVGPSIGLPGFSIEKTTFYEVDKL